MNNKAQPILLAIDTATTACSVSLKMGERSLTKFELTPQTHANHVLSMVESLLTEVGIKGDEVDYLVLGEGPGAFTGIRIAAGVVQGLAFGWQKPVIAISTLEALAWPVLQQNPESCVAACLDARMKELYFQKCWMQSDMLVSDASALLSERDAIATCEQNGIQIGCGDISSEFPQLTLGFESFYESLPNAEALADIASQRLKSAKNLSESLPLPVYLRNTVAEKPKVTR